jgi:hypothetical protein
LSPRSAVLILASEKSRVGTPFGIRGKKWMAKIKVAKLDGDEMARIMWSELI